MTTITKNDFPKMFTLDFVLLLLACIMAIAQLVNGSVPGFAGFGLIAYVIGKLMMIERK